MLTLTFKQTKAEIMVRAAATIIFNTLSKAGYPLVPLSEVAEQPQYGFTASASFEPVGLKFVRITDLQDGGINWDTVPYCKCDTPENYLLAPNDILFARTGATTGKTHLVNQAPGAVFASYLIRLRPKNPEYSKYLYSFFQSDAYWLQISDEKKGSAQPNVNGRKLISIQVPMVDSQMQSAISKFLEVVRRRQDGSCEQLPELPPPLEEQRRIVARVEELAGKIEEARSLRQQALEETEALRVSIAKAIFTELAKTNTQPLRELVTVQGGGTPSKRNPLFWEGSIPWISPKDMKIREIYDSFDHISEEATLKTSAKLLEPNSVLIVVRGMILAHTVPSAVLRVPAAINQDMKALVPSEQITPKYLSSVLWGLNYLLLELIEKSSHDTRKLETPKLLNFKIPVPTIAEQHRIVAYIDNLQAKVDEMKRLREQAMKELDALLPSLLDKAFKGEL